MAIEGESDSIEDELTNAITAFKMRLDNRPQGRVETVNQQGTQIRTTSFNAQLPAAPPSNVTSNGQANNSDQPTPAPVNHGGNPPPPSCSGFGHVSLSLAISGVTACAPYTGPVPNGVFVVPFDSDIPGSFCKWDLDDGTFSIVIFIFSDGTIQITVTEDATLQTVFQTNRVALGGSYPNVSALPCSGVTPTAGGSATVT